MRTVFQRRGGFTPAAWADLERAEQVALNEIQLAIQLLSGSGPQLPLALRPGRVQPKRQGGAEHALLSRLELETRLERWIEDLKKAEIPAGAIFDMVIDGASLSVIDRRFKRRNGWARSILRPALRLHPAFLEEDGYTLGLEVGVKPLAAKLATPA